MLPQRGRVMAESTDIVIYDTLSRKKGPMTTRETGRVSLYICGPTVYNYVHIGNARTFISFDMIRRYLEYRGFIVDFVQNITDVDDKIINKAKEEGVDPREVAERYTEAFRQDMDLLGIASPTHAPKATEFIPQMITMIEGLILSGNAYEVEGDVYYSIESFETYGKLSRRKLDEMRAGERVEVDQRKGHPMDFALWKSSKPGEPFWDSPWGPGRPGWHIECSVMSLDLLGRDFDIHGGAQDLIFPHHENEVAQSEASLGIGQFARQWLHAGLLQLNKEKMSKSTGNFTLLRDLFDDWTASILRLFMSRTHYRQPLEFSDEGLAEAREALRRFEDLLFSLDQILVLEADKDGDANTKDSEFEATTSAVELNFRRAMDDDFNTAEALAVLFEYVNDSNRYLKGESLDTFRPALTSNLRLVAETLRKLLGVIGVDVPTADGSLNETVGQAVRGLMADLGESVSEGDGTVNLLNRVFEVRAEARAKKDWARADVIRDGLAGAGIGIEDTSFGTMWKPVEKS